MVALAPLHDVVWLMARRSKKRPLDGSPRLPACKQCGTAAETRGGLCEDCTLALVSAWSRHLSAPSAPGTIRSYGLTVEDHAQMFTSQGGRCGICRDPERSQKTDRQGSGLVIDHDHVTGKVRGLLCARCNTAIGLLADDRMWLAQARVYLLKADATVLAARLEKAVRRVERMALRGYEPPPKLLRWIDETRAEVA